MDPWILLSIFASFMVVYLALPFWIRKAKQIGLLWEDMHKKNKEKNVAGSGGTMAVMGFIFGILLYVAISTFYLKSSAHLIEIFSLGLSVMIVAGVGFIDDLFGWQKGGLSKRSRIILVLFSAVPLMVINVGDSSMLLPFFGAVDFGVFYALFIVPLGIIGATTTFNFLAGYNGLESSQGILVLGAMAVTTYLVGMSWLSVIALYGVAVLLAFYIFNFHPAKVFPGDVMTYFVGGLIAIIAILGNIEKIAVIFFLPYIFEALLKIRGGLVKHSFAKLKEDGSLDEPYDKVYGLEHLAVRILKKVKKSKKVYEKDVVFFINFIQLIFIALGFLTL